MITRLGTKVGDCDEMRLRSGHRVGVDGPAARVPQTAGDVPGEKPLWAKTGGLDFDGRDRWEAHKSLKGQSTEEAKLTFVQAWGRANSKERERINFRPT